MGQKVNPHGLRVGVIKNWDTSWFASKKDFSKYLAEDYKIRDFIKRKCYQFGVSKIEIERAQGKVIINILTSKPGMIIGQRGAGIELLKKDLTNIVKDKSIHLNVLEVKRPDLDSILIAESIAAQLEKRASFKRTMKQAMAKVMRSGARGVKVMLSGRLDGAEIARSVHYHEGSIPLQTIRADIDYGVAEAHTTFGIIGVKVWVYKGEILGKPSILDGHNKSQDNDSKSGQRDSFAPRRDAKRESKIETVKPVEKKVGQKPKIESKVEVATKVEPTVPEKIVAETKLDQTKVESVSNVVDKVEKETKVEKLKSADATAKTVAKTTDKPKKDTKVEQPKVEKVAKEVAKPKEKAKLEPKVDKKAEPKVKKVEALDKPKADSAAKQIKKDK